MAAEFDFRRARRFEQIDQRRNAILTAARAALDERPLREVTLGALAERAGIAASGLLRYFDSREAIFSEILASEIDSWLDELDDTLQACAPTDGQPTDADLIASTMASGLVRRPRLCELLSASAAVLEHNVSVESATSFKRRNLEQLDRLVGLLVTHRPDLPADAALGFATTAPHIVSGSWPHAKPSAAAAAAIREVAYPSVANGYEHYLAEAFANQLTGAISRRA